MTHIIYQLSQLTNIHVKNILKHTISIEQTVKLYHCSKLRGGSEKKLPLLVGCFQCICFLMKKTKNFYRALTPTNYTSLSIYIYGAVVHHNVCPQLELTNPTFNNIMWTMDVT